VNETKREAIEAIGKDYVENQTCMRHKENIRKKYRTIARVVNALFDQIPVPVVFQEEDPYNDYDHMAKTVGKEQQLRVYSGHASHPVMLNETNLKFRAVHDWFGHLKYDVNFTTTGEYHKWLSMCSDFPTSTHGVLFAEVVGQLGAIKYLPDGFASDRYEQKAVEAPPWWIHKIVRGINNSYE